MCLFVIRANDANLMLHDALFTAEPLDEIDHRHDFNPTKAIIQSLIRMRKVAYGLKKEGESGSRMSSPGTSQNRKGNFLLPRADQPSMRSTFAFGAWEVRGISIW